MALVVCVDEKPRHGEMSHQASEQKGVVTVPFLESDICAVINQNLHVGGQQMERQGEQC